MAQPIRERCSGCGAAVEIEALACAYCGAPSPHAQRAKVARDEAELAREEADIRAAQEALARSGTFAVVWSVVGAVTCCAPFASAIGLAMGLKARRTALSRGWVPQAKATVAIVLSAASLVACVGFWIMVALEMKADQERQESLRAYVEAHADESPLTQPTACALVELRLREDGYGEHAGNTTGRAFECAGRLTIDGARATLADVSFKPSSREGRVHLEGCLARGGRWYVQDVVPHGEACPESARAE